MGRRCLTHSLHKLLSVYMNVKFLKGCRDTPLPLQIKVYSLNSSVAKDETSSHPPTSHRSKMLPTFGDAEAYFKIVIFPAQQKCAKGSNDNIHHQLL